MGGRAAILYTLRNNYRSPGNFSIGRSDISKLNQRDGGTVDFKSEYCGVRRTSTGLSSLLYPDRSRVGPEILCRPLSILPGFMRVSFSLLSGGLGRGGGGETTLVQTTIRRRSMGRQSAWMFGNCGLGELR
jgi:hypothetical protein